MATPIIREELKQINKSHGGSLNQWVGGLMHTTVQTRYDLQYIKIRLSGYMNAPTQPAFISLKHDMEYLMHDPHETIMYSIKKIHRTDGRPPQCYFRAGDAEIRKNKEYSNFLHTYFYGDRARDIYDRLSVTSKVYLFSGTIIDWCSRKHYETSRRSSNA